MNETFTHGLNTEVCIKNNYCAFQFYIMLFINVILHSTKLQSILVLKSFLLTNEF